MRVGEMIAITQGGHLSLVGFIEKLEGGVVGFWVWNGCWQAELHKGGVIKAFDGDHLVNTVTGCRVAYCGPHMGRDYNEAMGLLTEYLQRPLVARWWLQTRQQVSDYRQRLKNGCEGFLEAFRAAPDSRRRSDLNDPFDDTIPF